MKLYYSPGACSLASHIILHEVKADFEISKVDFTTKTTEDGEDYTKINPQGSVPVLALDNGKILTEGVAIMQYLADLNPEYNLAPKSATFERARLYEKLNYLTSELHKGFVPLFYKSTEEEKQKAKTSLGIKFDNLDKLLSNKTYLLGDTYSVADAYLFVISSWTKMVGIDLNQWKNVAAFCKKITKREAVQKALKAEGLLG